MPRVLFLAPGAGLGHLVRSTGLAWRLRQAGLDAEVATFSPFAAGMARCTGVPIVKLASESWVEALPAFVAESAPDLVVVDSFPGGLRGESFEGPPVVYLARRLLWRDYVAAHPPPAVAATLRLEALEPAHDAWLSEHGGEVVVLPGPVRFPLEAARSEPPSELVSRLDVGAALVVHSGPPHEVEALLEVARGLTDDAVLVTPDPRAFPGFPAFEAFPAASLFSRAAWVVTGGGYNAMAEGALLGERHRAVAFPRRWDDQAARLEAQIPNGEGSQAAVEAITRRIG